MSKTKEKLEKVQKAYNRAKIEKYYIFAKKSEIVKCCGRSWDYVWQSSQLSSKSENVFFLCNKLRWKISTTFPSRNVFKCGDNYYTVTHPRKARQEYIIEVFHNNNQASLFRPIPITKQEAIAQENDANMSKAEIGLKIETLLEHMSESVQKKYGGFKSSLWSDKIINVMVDEEEAIETIEHPIKGIILRIEFYFYMAIVRRTI
ncbi:4782_t:CDS:1 [Paraglomus brasilianum]|uniref:4782_t:CDS:1 n=1 Tax=Paraglomus brasilianum TaxID=144538 RepID=A0A9N9FVP7_9GLOM|nr:4782_t:CDS:1 [Paraglomus brasilianum]